MARGATKSTEVNELTKQIIAEIVAEEYKARGITSDPESLYTESEDGLGRVKKEMPTITSWYDRLVIKNGENTIDTYQYHFDYLVKVMKQYCKKFNGQMAYFDGQSTFELMESCPFININISKLEERFARPLAQQILLGKNMLKRIQKIRKKQDLNVCLLMRLGCF